MRTKQIVLSACLTCLFLHASFCQCLAAGKQPDHLKMVRSYSDTLIENGRDTYGTEQSPLFASTLDRGTLSLMSDKLGRIQGIRNGDRSLSGANPMHDQNLHQVLYARTKLTGKRCLVSISHEKNVAAAVAVIMEDK